MEKLLERVALHIAIGDLAAAIREIARAWQAENPDEEIVIVALPRNDHEERRRVMDFTFRMMEEEAKQAKAALPPERESGKKE